MNILYRIVILVDFREKSYAAICCSKVALHAEERNFIVKTEEIKGVTGTRNETGKVYLSEVFYSSQSASHMEEQRHSSPTKRWSQLERDQVHAETHEKAEGEEAIINFFEVDAVQISFEDESNVVDRIHVSTLHRVYFSWSPELHIIIMRAFGTVKK